MSTKKSWEDISNKGELSANKYDKQNLHCITNEFMSVVYKTRWTKADIKNGHHENCSGNRNKNMYFER